MDKEYNKAYITVRSEKDQEGKQSFTIQWKSNQVGYYRNLTGYFGQGFRANLEEHLQRLKDMNREIVFIKEELKNPHINLKTGLLI